MVLLKSSALLATIHTGAWAGQGALRPVPVAGSPCIAPGRTVLAPLLVPGGAPGRAEQAGFSVETPVQ